MIALSTKENTKRNEGYKVIKLIKKGQRCDVNIFFITNFSERSMRLRDNLIKRVSLWNYLKLKNSKYKRL